MKTRSETMEINLDGFCVLYLDYEINDHHLIITMGFFHKESFSVKNYRSQGLAKRRISI